MNAATIAALTAAVTAVIGAVTALVVQLQHRGNPAAHDGQGQSKPLLSALRGQLVPRRRS